MQTTAALAAVVLGLAVTLCACDRDGGLVRKEAAPVTRASEVLNGQLSFVGRWAAAESDCRRAAWTMTAARLQSPGALACSVSHVTPTMGGYTAYSGCSTGGADTPGRVVMTLSGSPPASALTLTGGPFAEPLALVRCPA